MVLISHDSSQVLLNTIEEKVPKKSTKRRLAKRSQNSTGPLSDSTPVNLKRDDESMRTIDATRA